MTTSRRDALICGALALAFAAVGIHFALQPSWWCVPPFYIAVLLIWCERHLTADHHRQLRAHDRARCSARVDSLRVRLADDIERQRAALPCCSFFVHSDGEVHGPDCTRLSDGSAA